jgi:hypothetical protein
MAADKQKIDQKTAGGAAGSGVYLEECLPNHNLTFHFHLSVQIANLSLR